MLVKITLLTSLLFAVLYPLCFWISGKDPLKNNFHKFHIGLPNVVGGITLIFILLMDLPLSVKIAAVIWKVSLVSFSSYFWKKEYPKPLFMTIPSLLGLYAYAQMQTFLLGSNLLQIIAAILGGLIFCASLFAMNLGHWYLNVHGLPIIHLKRSCYVLWGLLGVRLLWNIGWLFQGKVFYGGDWIRLIQFISSMDGFLILLGFFFGIVFPFVSLFLVREILKLKNTQAVTGILYVILCSIILGDITYKYYLIKFGVAL